MGKDVLLSLENLSPCPWMPSLFASGPPTELATSGDNLRNHITNRDTKWAFRANTKAARPAVFVE
ncbi:hypothetical protein CHGG_05720 [Chaetomium globosum CBS 148.51]|uniref:Uncharacterized protein n=1 Tax=Chaetomium globosum (strain ATCC 6205 / CBS 148.51 / DSM 1962 / NBRC 6347 / NRRL 1970) TaxID=306901 RepID=Q2H6J5_CHAGB|nr:uncharacterized protein CHGG_05720 [Chaetomium globosum CBS 148.51]EAQ89101.1 hypothetical protein CHGG_05720 [Chaetomium globosum CBS 148.51]